MSSPGLNATKLVLVLPVLGLVVTSVVVSVGLAPKAVRYAEIHGGPTSSAEGFFGRVILIEEEAEIVRPLSGSEARVGVRSGGVVSEVLVSSGSEGAADFSIEKELPSDLREVWVHDEKGNVLVEGRLDAKKLARLEPAKRRGGRVAIEKSGLVPFDVVVERGVLAAPFSGRVIVRPRGDTSGLRLSISLSGGALNGALEQAFEPGKELGFEVAPSGHDVELDIRVLRDSLEVGKGTGRLPVAPGAFFPEFSSEKVRIRSPVARDFVYYAWHTERARLSSGRASLVLEADGTASAEIPRLVRNSPELLYLVLASDPSGSGSGTVGFPLEAGSPTLDRRDELLLDGRAQRLAIEKQRTTRLRRALVLYVGLLFALTLVLFVTILRRSAKKLTESLSREVEGPIVSPHRGALVPAFVIALGMSGALFWFAFLAR